MSSPSMLRRSLAVVVLVAVVCPLVIGQALPVADGPVQFVDLPAEKTSTALAEVEQGTLIRMPAAEFAKLVSKAERPNGDKPAILAARYRAKLVVEQGEANLIGTAEWSLRNSSIDPAMLTLDGMQLALKQAKWTDGQDAVLFKPSPDQPPRLLVPPGADRSLNLEWSARGSQEPAEVRFELRTPSTPIGSLELELPAGYSPVVVQDGALLTGPFPAENGASSWRIGLGGLTRVEIVLRRVSDVSPRLFARLFAIQNIYEADGSARYEFQVESAKAGMNDMTFECDPAFVPAGVRVNNLASWNFADNKLIVKLSEPTRSATVVVNGTFSWPNGPTAWQSPAVTLANAVPLGERLSIAIAPGVRFRDWRAGGYRIVKASALPDRTYQIEAEPLPLPVGQKAPARPSLALNRTTATWTVEQRAEWTVLLARDELMVQNLITVNSGVMTSVAFRPMVDWEIDRIEIDGRESSAEIVGTPPRINIDLPKAVRPNETADITVRLRRQSPSSDRSFPDLLPIGAANRTGKLTIRPGPGVSVDPSAAPSASPAKAGMGDVLERSLGPELLAGKLVVVSATPRADVSIVSEVFQSAAGSNTEVVLNARLGTSALSELTLWLPGDQASPWAWRGRDGRHVADAQRARSLDARAWLLTLGMPSSLGMAVNTVAMPVLSGSHWRIKLPKSAEETRELLTTIPSADDQLALPWLVGQSFTGSARITGRNGVRRDVQYGPGGLGSTFAMDGPFDVDGLRLLTTIGPTGNARASCRFRVRCWPTGPMRVTLPPGAEHPVVRIAGRLVDVGSTSPLSIPVPSTGDWVSIELYYDLPGRGEGWISSAKSPVPELPFDTSSLVRVWHISPNWRVARSSGAMPVPGTLGRGSSLPLPQWRSWFVERIDPREDASIEQRSLSAALRREPGDRPLVIDAMTGARWDELVPANTSLADFLTRNEWSLVRVDEALVLTTRASASRWMSDEPPNVRRAVAEALEFGRDESGRFRLPTEPLIDPEVWQPPPHWSIWFGHSADERVVLVRQSFVFPMQWIVCLLLIGAIVFVVRTASARWMMMAILLTVGVILAATLSESWTEIADVLLICVVAGTVLLAYRSTSRRGVSGAASSRGRIVRPAITSAAMVALGATALAAGPALTAYRVNIDGSPYVLVTPRTLDRLRERGTVGSGIAITSADYSTRREDGAIRARARYRLWSFTDAKSRVMLPFGAARLREVRLDAAEATEVEITGDSLHVAVTGKGWHTLELDFSVPIVVVGTDRELRLTIPEVPIARMAFELPKPTQRPRTSLRRGAVRSSSTPQGELLEADIGLSSSIQARWSADPTGRSALIRAREATLVDVGPGYSHLTTLVEHRITGGAISELKVAIPDGAEVYRVSVRTDAATTPRVKSWTIGQPGSGGLRPLTVELQTPFEGRIVLVIELYLGEGGRERTTVQVPHALQVAESQPHLAIVSAWDELAAPELADLAELPIDLFTRTVWTPLSGTPAKIRRAYRSTAGPNSRLSIGPMVPAASMGVPATELNWWLAPGRLIGNGTTVIAGPTTGLVEWQIAGNTRVGSLSAVNLMAWSQTGDRVQAWFDRPFESPRIAWSASRTRPTDTGEIAVPQPTFSPRGSTTTLVRASDGQSLVPRGAKGKFDVDSNGTVRWNNDPTARVEVLAPVVAPVGLSILVRPAAERIQATYRLDVSGLPSGRPHRFALVVRDADGFDIRVSLGSTTFPETTSEVGGRRWEVVLPEGRPAEPLQLVASRAGTWSLPHVSIRYAPGKELEPALVIRAEGDAVRLLAQRALTRTSANEWRSTGPTWSGRVSRESGVGSVRFSRAIIHAWRGTDRWHFFGEFRLTGEDTIAMRVIPPSGAGDVRGWWAGQSLPLIDGTMSVSAGPQPIECRWSSDEPSWHAPQFVRTDGPPIEGTVEWIIHSAPGMRPAASGGVRTVPTTSETLIRGLPVRTTSTLASPAAVEWIADRRSGLNQATFLGACICVAFVLSVLWSASLGPERVALAATAAAVIVGGTASVLWMLVGLAIIGRVAILFRGRK